MEGQGVKNEFGVRVEKSFSLFCVVANQLSNMVGPRAGSFETKMALGDFSPGCAVGGRVGGEEAGAVLPKPYRELWNHRLS